MPQLFNVFKGQMSLVGPEDDFRSNLENTELTSNCYELKPGSYRLLAGEWQAKCKV